MAEEDEKQRKVEEEFAAEVWNHAGRKVSESVVGFLGASAMVHKRCEFELHNMTGKNAGRMPTKL